ncbi:MAG: NUDIX domain-containing protein [Candidatus Aenigmatarchaeota archaeon]
MGEKLDVVDENDNVIRTEEREAVHSTNAWHRQAHIFIFNSKGEMLVQLRSPDKDRFPGTLEGSMTEHVRAGESYEEAAARGLKEEFGINIPLKELLHFRIEYSPNERVIGKLFEGNYDGEVKLSEETVNVRFMNENQLKELLEKSPHKLAPWFIENLKWKLGLPHNLHIFTK